MVSFFHFSGNLFILFLFLSHYSSKIFRTYFYCLPVVFLCPVLVPLSVVDLLHTGCRVLIASSLLTVHSVPHHRSVLPEFNNLLDATRCLPCSCGHSLDIHPDHMSRKSCPFESVFCRGCPYVLLQTVGLHSYLLPPLLVLVSSSGLVSPFLSLVPFLSSTIIYYYHLGRLHNRAPHRFHVVSVLRMF